MVDFLLDGIVLSFIPLDGMVLSSDNFFTLLTKISAPNFLEISNILLLSELTTILSIIFFFFIFFNSSIVHPIIGF